MSSDRPRSLEDLLDAAGRAVQPTAFGWETLPARLAQTPQKRPLTLKRWATLPLGVAAAATILLVIWLGTSRQEAEAGPIRVERQSVDLTILSTAETDGETLYMPIAYKLGRQLLGASATLRFWEPHAASGTARVWDEAWARGLAVRKQTGQALVRDRRLILNLRRGDNLVRFTDVAATIDPTSVRLVSTTDPAGTHVVEQSFEYDLATADSVLKRCLDRKVTCIGKGGEETTGYLAAYDASAIVLASSLEKQAGTESVNQLSLRAVRLDEPPADLIVKPTLVWKLRTRTPGRHETTLSYICGFLRWQADYVVHVTPGEKGRPDLLDVKGWVTLENTSGSTYPDAGLRLIAGDVNRVKDPWAAHPPNLEDALDRGVYYVDGQFATRPGFLAGERQVLVERSFFEYHLYALTLPSTVRDRQIKQLNLLERAGVKATRRYVYDPEADPRRLAVELLAKNDKANNLGLPLPKGRVTLQQRGADGESAVLGRAAIDHTAVKEELTLRYMNAFDVAGEHREVSFELLSFWRARQTLELRVRNHKNEAIQVRAFGQRLEQSSRYSQSLLQATMKAHFEDARRFYFEFLLGANEERVIRYTIETRSD